MHGTVNIKLKSLGNDTDDEDDDNDNDNGDDNNDDDNPIFIY